MKLYFFSILAGFLTILAPCILPLLPVVLGVGASNSRKKAYQVIIGFILSFSVIGGLIATTGSFIGLNQSWLRLASVLLLAFFGLTLIFPAFQERFFAKVVNPISKIGTSMSGKAGNLLLGASLGLVWAPCAGPILGTILTLAAVEKDPLLIISLLFAYALGASIPMLIVAHASQRLLSRLQAVSRHYRIVQLILGILILICAIAIATGYDRVFQASLINLYPTSQLAL